LENVEKSDFKEVMKLSAYNPEAVDEGLIRGGSEGNARNYMGVSPAAIIWRRLIGVLNIYILQAN
jgi:hypothetical protein